MQSGKRSNNKFRLLTRVQVIHSANFNLLELTRM